MYELNACPARPIDAAESFLARARPGASERSMRAMPAETRRSYVSAPIRFVFSTESHDFALGAWGPPQKTKCVYIYDVSIGYNYIHNDTAVVS